MHTNSHIQNSHLAFTDQKTSNSILNRQKRHNGGVFEESVSASFERECMEEKCSSQEYDETENEHKKSKTKGMTPAEDAAAFKLKKDHIFNGCNIKSKENLDTTILPYICHPENTQTCRSEYRKVDCVCKPAYLQCSSVDCREDIDIVRCSTSKYECQFGTVIEGYFKRKCDCATNTLNSFLEVGKQLENGIFLDDFVKLDKIALRQNKNYAEKFNELISFGDDKECREITSQVGELCESVGINPCFGNKNSVNGGEYLEDVALNKINDFKCKCVEVQIYNEDENSWKSVALFDGRYCQNDIRSTVLQTEFLQKNDICLESKGNKADIIISETGTASLKCRCVGSYGVKIQTSNRNWQVCEPPKTCGINQIWSEKVRYDEKCQCPELAANGKKKKLILQGESCSNVIQDEELQQFCIENGICGMKPSLIENDLCELDFKRMNLEFKGLYDSEFITCKCRLEDKYYKNDKCVAKSCKELCNSIDVKLETCDFNYNEPNNPVDCKCMEGYKFARATDDYASICAQNSTDQKLSIDPKSGKIIDTGGSGKAAVVTISIVVVLILLIVGLVFCFKNKIIAWKNGKPTDFNDRNKYKTQDSKCSRKGLVTDGSKNSSPKSENYDLESQSLKNKVSSEHVLSSPVTTSID